MAGAGPSTSQGFESVFSALTERRFHDIARLLDNLELELGGATKDMDWPYVLHLLGHVFLQDLNSARFLWKRIPEPIKQNTPELQAAWRVVQALWQHNRPGVHAALKGYAWSQPVQPLVQAIADETGARLFQLLSTAYSSMYVDDAAQVLGLDAADTTSLALQADWSFDPTSNILTTKKSPKHLEQSTGIGHLQNLTDYVFQLEQ